MKSEQVVAYLAEQGITAGYVEVTPSFFDPKNQLDGTSFDAIPYAKQTDTEQDLADTYAESMSLASMFAVTQLCVKPSMRVLDVCAAPGMKGLYLNKLCSGIDYYVNDLSGDRLARLSRLFTKHDTKPLGITKYDARFIDRAYEPKSFDAILLDAPCSGEGVILGGNTKLLYTWSTAKVKRLQQLQVKILKKSWQLLKPGGRLVYATCTLNKNENERAIKKALGITVNISESSLNTNNIHMLENGKALRILPSINSIGFFVAVLEKGIDD